ncbi:hypothetical protein [Dongia deserti]|uniref:hypothetical protein n=1 Tax=Dongia deserti TaxID=2268030 RepID=UPI0013C4B2F6|nr:hypothetical protein [Dongia deserti]
MSDLTAEKITNLYLWGTETRPTDLLSSNVIRPGDATKEYTVDINDYMTNGPGR